MPRRPTFLMIGLLIIGLASCHLAADTRESRPNIILILADDLGYHDLGCQGATDIQSPHIDAIAAAGMRFTDAHVSASVCSPSRAGLLTGRYQQRFGHEANTPPHGKGMDPAESTIGDALQKLGYHTAIIGKWHVGSEMIHHPIRRGFNYFYGLREGSRSYWYEPQKNDRPGSPHAIEEGTKNVKFDGYLTDVFGDQAVAYIERQKNKPFFLFLSFTAPHTPMHAKDEDLKRFAHIPDKRRRTYAAMIWAMDRAVGKVMGALKKHELADNTVIWFLSDNGGATNNGSLNTPLAGHKGIKFEGGLRVPFLMQWKEKIFPGTIFDGLVCALDIFPTCIAAAGGDPAQNPLPLDGVDLTPFVTGKKSSSPHDKLYWHKLWFSAGRAGPWKIIYVQDYGYALYNLENDLPEAHNLASTHPAKLELLKQDLNAWKAQMSEPLWDEPIRWFHTHSRNHIRIIEGVGKP